MEATLLEGSLLAIQRISSGNCIACDEQTTYYLHFTASQNLLQNSQIGSPYTPPLATVEAAQATVEAMACLSVEMERGEAEDGGRMGYARLTRTIETSSQRKRGGGGIQSPV